MLNYNEQWIVSINRKEFVINGEEKTKLSMAMQNGDRWFETLNGDILSVSHIESVVLHSKEIKNQLPEGKKEEPKPISDERWEELKKKLPFRKI